MSNIEQSVPARYFALLLDHLDAGVAQSLDDTHALLNTCQVDALLAELRSHTGRTDLGFELGRQIRLTSHDVLSHAILGCPTVDHVLRLVARYYRLVMPLFTLRYRRQPGCAELLLQPVWAMRESTLHFYLETLAVSLHTHLMAVTAGRIGPHDIHLSLPEPPHLQRYRTLAPARFHFHAAQVGVRAVFGTRLLDQPLEMANPRAHAQAEARCKRLLRDRDSGRHWGDWVEMMLRAAGDNQPTLEQLARILNVSARTLERHLARDHVNFRALALAIRNERACRMLASGQSPISQIAYQLGYSDLANFSRSFKKMNGVSPSAYLEQRRSAIGH